MNMKIKATALNCECNNRRSWTNIEDYIIDENTPIRYDWKKFNVKWDTEERKW